MPSRHQAFGSRVWRRSTVIGTILARPSLQKAILTALHRAFDVPYPIRKRVKAGKQVREPGADRTAQCRPNLPPTKRLVNAR